MGRYVLSDTHQLYNDMRNKSYEKGPEHWMYEDSTTKCKRTELIWQERQRYSLTKEKPTPAMVTQD